MSAFLSNITKRHFGEVPLVTARKRALFETNRFSETANISIEEETLPSSRIEEVDTSNSLLEVASDTPKSNLPTTSENPMVDLSLGELVQQPIKGKPSKEISNTGEKITLLTANTTDYPNPAINSDATIGDLGANEETSLTQGNLESILITNNNLPKASPSIHQQTMIVQNHFEQTRGNASDLIASAPTQLPNVKIHIGRIEVKAAPQNATPTKKTRKNGGKPKLSLEQYLKNKTS